MLKDLFFTSFADILFSILRDSKRRRLLVKLLNTTLTADQITEFMQITRPAVEKHLKQMMEIGLIERQAEMYPKLHYLYHIPDCYQDFIQNLDELLLTLGNELQDEYTIRLENEEQAYISTGPPGKNRYDSMKQEYKNLVDKMKP